MPGELASLLMAEAVELVLDAKARLGEGAVWDAQRQLLYWVDIEGHEVHVFDPAAVRDRSFALGDSVGTVVPRAKGGLALTLGRAFAALDLETRKVSVLAEPEEEKVRSGNRCNDGKCDRRGGSRWHPARVRRLRRPALPLSRVTSCAFGGAGLDELCVTTAWSRLDPGQRRPQPVAGRLFRIRPGVKGVPAFAFAG